MLTTKSRRAVAASVLALAAAGGGSFAAIRLASPSAAPTFAAQAALPSPDGTAATASVPRGPGGADGTGTGSAYAGGAAPAIAGQGTAGAAPPLSRSAGQGDPGPLPAHAVPADGAVPGASPAIQALAAARAATAALPHSPQLLGQLTAAAGAPGTGAAPTPSGAPSPAASPSPSATSSSPAATPSASSAPASSAPASAAPTASTAPATAVPTATATVTPAPSTAPATAVPAASTLPADSPAIGAAASPAAQPQAAAPRALAGLDVAGFQHPVSSAHPGGEAISWTAVAAAGYKFAAVKATEGDYYVNPWAATDLAEAKAAGLDVDPYHFAVPNVSGGAAQAQFAVEYSGYVSGTRMLPLMLDIEYDPYVSTDHTNECYGLTPASMTAWLAAFVATARSLTGQYPVIYTAADWWDTCTGRSAAFGADPMWVAAYGYASPPMPTGWRIWTFWQHTSDGTVPGVATSGTTDLDTFSYSAVGLIDPGVQSAKAGARVSLPVGSLGALAGETLRYAAPGLPPGLAVSATGAVTGTVAASAAPSKAVTYQVTVSAVNASGSTGTVSFGWKVAPA